MHSSKNPYFGAIEDTFDERDFQLAAGVLDLPVSEHDFHDEKILYSQNTVSPVSCTIHAAIGAASDLLAERFSTVFVKKIWEYSLTRGASEKWGYYVNNAVQDVRKKVNETGAFPELVTFRMVLCGEDFWTAIERGYSVVTGYRGNAEFNKDFLDDGILDGEDFSKFTYGHSIRIIRSSDQTVGLVVDNYPERKFTIYQIKNETLRKLWANKVFFNSGYVFATRKSFIRPKTQVSPWAIKSVEKAVLKKKAMHWDNPQEIVGNAVAEQIFLNLGALTQQRGNLSKERMIVALDNLKLLD